MTHGLFDYNLEKSLQKIDYIGKTFGAVLDSMEAYDNWNGSLITKTDFCSYYDDKLKEYQPLVLIDKIPEHPFCRMFNYKDVLEISDTMPTYPIKIMTNPVQYEYPSVLLAKIDRRYMQRRN